MTTEYTLEELEEIISEGRVLVQCTHCDRQAVIEPDGDYECPYCHEGRLVSPLVELGWI